MNLLAETEFNLEVHNKTLNDVEWIGCPTFEVNKEQFIELANVEYDDGFGAPEVATDLLVVGSGWWLERHEYDGSEWWEFKEEPKRPAETRKIKALIGGMWSELEELQSDG